MNGRQPDNHRNRKFSNLLRRAADFDRFAGYIRSTGTLPCSRIEMPDPEERQSLEIMVPVFVGIRSSAVCTQLPYTTQI